jgi:hypothetical protein
MIIPGSAEGCVADEQCSAGYDRQLTSQKHTRPHKQVLAEFPAFTLTTTNRGHGQIMVMKRESK